MLLLALLSSAHAFTSAGFGVFAPGGGLTGPSEPGALGLYWTPAAARPALAEIALDVAPVYLGVEYTLELDPSVTTESIGPGVAPSFAAAVPLGPIGLGFSFVPLYARGGSEPLDPTGPQRFHSIEGLFQILVAEPAIAWQINERVTVGACGRVGFGQVSSRSAVDSGALINDAVGAGTVPLGDPFLEGTQTLSDLKGRGFGAGAGIRVQATERISVDLAARTGIDVQMSGAVELIPSNDLDLALNADVDTTLPMPPGAFLGIGLPAGKGRVVLEASWLGWSSFSSYDSALSNAAVSSGDPLAQSLLEGYGLTDVSDLLSSTTVTTGMRDTFNQGASLRWPVGDAWEVRGGVWHMQNAVPDEWLHPSNIDFDALDLRAAGIWSPKEWITAGIAADWLAAGDREITDSIYGVDDPNDIGAATPSGNGTYAVTVARLGVTAVFRPGAR